MKRTREEWMGQEWYGRVGSRVWQRRRRKLNAALLVAMMIISIWLGIYVSLAQNEAYEYEETIIYTVQPGDTLWSICRSNSTSSHDVRRVIDEVRELNDIGDVLLAGTRLVIPDYST